ncbi:MAG: SsrA-binding protein [Bacteroidota bacterium]
MAKIEIALARGKKLYDKREDMKRQDAKNEMDRLKKSRR